MGTSDTKFTPAPWRLVRCACGDPVCKRWGTSNGTFYQGIGYEEADSHLVAAAPELYAAAKRALAVLKAQGESVRSGSVVGALDIALRKARGER